MQCRDFGFLFSFVAFSFLQFSHYSHSSFLQFLQFLYPFTSANIRLATCSPGWMWALVWGEKKSSLTPPPCDIQHWPPSALHAPGAHTGSLTCTGPQSIFGCSFAGCPHCPQMHKYLHTWLCIDTGGPCCVNHSVTCSIRGTANICILTTRFHFHHNKEISLVWQV